MVPKSSVDFTTASNFEALDSEKVEHIYKPVHRNTSAYQIETNLLGKHL